MTTRPAPTPIKAILFDLLTALLDSWTIWNRAAGSEQAGRAWRAEYLRLSYSCGAYVPYEELIHQAADNTHTRDGAPEALEVLWPDLPTWSGAQQALIALAPDYKLAIVTNCSNRLARVAAERLSVNWDAVVTAEEAGFYKPHPKPYQLALSRLGVQAHEVLFVAGSGYDLFGTAPLGIPTYWHNRVGAAAPEGAPAPHKASTHLTELVSWAHAFKT
jgi:2-haloacid dehalogenase